ncbi:MAG: hypothetical protein FJ403_21200 [Verrucomicrobia bacterium]|nr:hypothetical protein [Verrucomicrobiota bacterium]
MNPSADAMTKLENLSEERARKVISLIDDLTELEELEKRADLIAALASLAEPGEDIPWEQVKKELDAKFDYPASAGQEVSR